MLPFDPAEPRPPCEEDDGVVTMLVNTIAASMTTVTAATRCCAGCALDAPLSALNADRPRPRSEFVPNGACDDEFMEPEKADDDDPPPESDDMREESHSEPRVLPDEVWDEVDAAEETERD